MAAEQLSYRKRLPEVAEFVVGKSCIAWPCPIWGVGQATIQLIRLPDYQITKLGSLTHPLRSQRGSWGLWDKLLYS
jgi:hypothetical protein